LKAEQVDEQVIEGMVASEGIAVGPLILWDHAVVCNRLAGDVAAERAAFTASIASACKEISILIADLDEMPAEIMEFHLAMLEDEDFLRPAEKAIDQGIAADNAWRQICDAEIRNYANSDSEYLAARVNDLRDIRDRVLRVFADDQDNGGQSFPDGGVVFAQDMTPSAFLGFDWTSLAGTALRGGSPTSHVSILARARSADARGRGWPGYSVK
jgi:phosphoenolpyruvate-protein phosphotransferase (PTS system enzyme I)